MDELKWAIQTVYSQSLVSHEEREKAFNYLNVLSSSDEGWKLCLPLPFSQESIQLRYFSLHVLMSQITNLESPDLLNVKETMINYLNTSFYDSNDDLSLIKKMAQLYVKLIIQIYPEKWPNPFQELLYMVNNSKSIPNCVNTTISFIHVDLLTSVLEIINRDVIEYALYNNSTMNRNNAKNLKESMGIKNITDISACLVHIIKGYNNMNMQVLDRCLATTVDILSWADWRVFSTAEFLESVINIINLRNSVSINALRIISALSERGMNPIQKAELMFQKLNIINLIKQLFANIINDGIVAHSYSPVEIQFISTRNQTLATAIHQIIEIHVALNRSGNDFTRDDEKMLAGINESIITLSHLLINCFKIYPLVSILPLISSACDIVSYVKYANLENNKTFANITIELFICTLKHASYPHWYSENKGFDEAEFEECRMALVSIIRNLFISTSSIAIVELGKNINHICAYRHQVLPCQSEVIIMAILVAIEVVKLNNDLVNAILPLFQTNSCSCCNQVSSILIELSKSPFVSKNINELIGKVSKAPDQAVFIKPSLQYLVYSMNNALPNQALTLLKFVKNSIGLFNDNFEATKEGDKSFTANLINSIRPFLGIQFVSLGEQVHDISASHLSIHYNEVYYEILSTLILNKPSLGKNVYFYETLDYLSSIMNQISQDQQDFSSLSFWLFRVLNAFSAFTKPFTFTTSTDIINDIAKAMIKFSEMTVPLVNKYSKYFYIRSVSLAISRRLIFLGKVTNDKDAVNCIIQLTKPLYNYINVDVGEDKEFCAFIAYLLKKFPNDYFDREFLSFVLLKHIKFVTPSMEIIKVDKISDLWRRQHDQLLQFLHLLSVVTASYSLDSIFDDFKLEGFEYDPEKFKSYYIKDRLLKLISNNSCTIVTTFTFLLVCCRSFWVECLTPKIPLIALQIMLNMVSDLEKAKSKLPLKLIFHTCASWLLDGQKRIEGVEQKLPAEACKILYKLAPAVTVKGEFDNEEFTKVIDSYSTLNINDFSRKLVNLNILTIKK